MPLNCTIAERYLSLRDVLALKPGDVIPVDLPDDYSLTANRVPLFQAALGKNRGNLALRITADANRPH